MDLDQLLDGLTLAKLQSIFESIMKRQENKIDPIRSKFGTIRREPVSLEQKVGSVMAYARKNRRFSFRQLLERQGRQAGSGSNVSGSAGIDEDGKDPSDTGAFV